MSGRTKLSVRDSTTAIVITMFLFQSGTTVPSPLYAVYQARLGFSEFTLTLTFGVYAIALLVALLVFGRLSDFIGRRRVIAAALALQVCSTVMFVTATSADGLIFARVVQGLATGLSVATLTTTLYDFTAIRHPGRASFLAMLTSTVGAASASLIVGIYIQLNPSSPQYVFIAFGVLNVATFVLVLFLDEPVAWTRGALASLRPRIAVPKELRGAFFRGIPSMVATWMLGSAFMSVAPTIAREFLGISGPLFASIALAILLGSSSIMTIALRSLSPARSIFIGGLILAAGMISLIGSLDGESALLFLGSAAVAGAGFGISNRGVIELVSGRATPRDRAGVTAALYVVFYLSSSIPVIVMGALIGFLGIRTAAASYFGVILVLAITAAFCGLKSAQLVRRESIPAQAVPPPFATLQD
jgi:MFS family permease